jgi:hypothetical protein
MLAAAPRVSLGDQPEVPKPPSAPDLVLPEVSVDIAPTTELHVEPAVAGLAGAPHVPPTPSALVPVELANVSVSVEPQIAVEPVCADVVAVQTAGVPVAVVTAGAGDRRLAQSGPRPKNEPEYELRRRSPDQPGSIEDRLERLERMVEKLANEPRPGATYTIPRQPGYAPQPHPVPGAPMAPPAPRVLPGNTPRAPSAAISPYAPADGKYSDRLNSVIKRADPDGMPSEIQLRALENRRKALEQQIAALESQLNQLERQQDALEREREKMEHDREMQLRERDRVREEREAVNQLRQAQREQERIQQREEQRRSKEQEKQKPSSNNAPAKENPNDAEDEAKNIGVKQ